MSVRAGQGPPTQPRPHSPTPVAGTSSVASKYEELECLYAAVGKVIYEGLTNYEKAASASPSQLFGECAPLLHTPLCSLGRASLLGRAQLVGRSSETMCC